MERTVKSAKPKNEDSTMEKIRDCIAYFFGKGDTPEFSDGSIAHIAPIVVMILTIIIIGLRKNKIRDSRYEKNYRYIMGFVMIICEMSYFWRLVGVPSLGAHPTDHLPITVCGWGVIFGSYMLVGKSQRLFDIAYFWLFSGTLFALITPAMLTYTGITRFRYYQFWIEHIMGYIAIFYMMFVHKMRPTPRSAVRSYIMLAILAAVAFFTNQLLGDDANYLFMALPEDTPTILDILPKNLAIRIPIMAAIITVMFYLAYLPWLIKDRKARKAQLKQHSILFPKSGELDTESAQ